MALSAAATSGPPTVVQRDKVASLLSAAQDFESTILDLLPPGRDRSLAITHLEDALMRANRAVFQPAAD
jgi:hypothetical protein